MGVPWGFSRGSVAFSWSSRAVPERFPWRSRAVFVGVLVVFSWWGSRGVLVSPDVQAAPIVQVQVAFVARFARPSACPPHPPTRLPRPPS